MNIIHFFFFVLLIKPFTCCLYISKLFHCFKSSFVFTIFGSKLFSTLTSCDGSSFQSSAAFHNQACFNFNLTPSLPSPLKNVPSKPVIKKRKTSF